MNYGTILLLAALFGCGIEVCEPLKVLGVFPTCGRSHWNVGNGVMMSLVEAGHEVTMISPFPLTKPVKNYRDIRTEGVLEMLESFHENFDPFESISNAWLSLPIITMLFDITGELTLTSPEVKELLKSNEKFDVIFVEIFMTEALLGLGQHFDAPVIGVSTFGSNNWVNSLTGTPAPASTVPNPFLSLTQDMTFLERLYNTVFNLYVDAYTGFVHLPRQKRYYNKHFPNARRSFEESLQNVSLVFLNTHISLGGPVPYAPNMIEIGGVNIDRTNKSLPKDLATIIESAKHGVIYFSLGSHLPSSRLPKKTIEVLLEAFGKLKQTVLWKLDNPAVIGDNPPKNLHTQTWFPQNELLAHPNVKFFISHGGLLSTTETVYHGKPIIGIPVLGDQHLNIAISVRAGFAIKVDYKTITLEQFEDALNEMLTNPKYAKNIERISSVYRDQPMTPRESVAYWTEYVVRHKGAPHFRSKAVEMCYLARNGFDVAITLVSIVTVITAILILGCLKCCKKCKTGTSVQKNNKKKSN